MNVSIFPIKVSTLDKTGKHRKELGEIAPGESLIVIDWGWHTLQIQNGAIINNYSEPAPPDECIEYRGWGPWISPTFQAGILLDDTLALDTGCTDPDSAFPVTPSSVKGITTQSSGTSV